MDDEQKVEGEVVEETGMEMPAGAPMSGDEADVAEETEAEEETEESAAE